MRTAEAFEPSRAALDVRRSLTALLGVPFTEGNRVDVLRNGDEIFPSWLQQISSATRSVDLLSYLWGKGDVTREVADALAARARAGVRVRVLLDALGSKGIDRSQVADLRSAGAQVRFYRPASNWRVSALNRRVHGRVLICDEEIAFTGGTGVDRAWTGSGRTSGDWRDSSFRVQGPAVDGLRGAFVGLWLQTPHALLTGHDRFPPLRRHGSAAVQVLHSAQRRVRIATPYARLPARLHQLVQDASRRGVQVQLLLPGPHVDHPFAALQGNHQHQQLLEAGVEIWRYQPSMLHVKVVTVDGAVAMVGSANIDARSLALNEQIQMLISDPATTAVLDGHYDDDLAESRRTALDDWRRRGVRERALDSVADVVGRPLRGLGAAGLTGRRP